jgi:hypothetical protein
LLCKNQWLTSISIIELNVAVICGCMPVLFVLMKTVAKKEYYPALLRYFRTRRTKASTEGEDQLPGPVTKQVLPAIPKPTMTGLRSFIWKAHRSQAQATIELETYDELTSVNDDYHAQLKAGRSWA